MHRMAAACMTNIPNKLRYSYIMMPVRMDGVFFDSAKSPKDNSKQISRSQWRYLMLHVGFASQRYTTLIKKGLFDHL